MRDPAAWRADVLAERAWREALYRGEDSPLAPEARKAFVGLRWFDLDPAFVAPARLERHPAPRDAGLEATGPDALRMLEVGRLRFELAGVPCALLAFEPAPGEADEEYVLLPFRDGTSGKESYGGGRYLDVEPRADDRFELDFNRAYHPYCAFDDRWACVLPPFENTLPLRVEAGERL